MWTQEHYAIGGNGKFFRLVLGQEDLADHYKLNIHLMEKHKFTLSDLDNMLPFEREIYVALLIQLIQKDNEEAQNG